jgi:hypothetical protein
VPSREEGFGTYWFQLIGQGASFCTTYNCGTAHHHGSVRDVIPGDIYSAKSLTTAFTTPTISEAVIEEDVLSVWRTLTLLLQEWNKMLLQEWNKKLFLAKDVSNDLPASKATVEMNEAHTSTDLQDTSQAKAWLRGRRVPHPGSLQSEPLFAILQGQGRCPHHRHCSCVGGIDANGRGHPDQQCDPDQLHP